MNKIILLFLGFLLTFSLSTQAQTEKKKLTRKERKELKQKQKQEEALQTAMLINSKRFVFQADEIIDRSGKSYSVSYSINFIVIDSNTAVFQFGSLMLIGINGAGGVTIEGKITKMEITKNEKNLYHYIVVRVATNRGFYDIQIDISPSGMATAKISNTASQTIVYKGVIVAPKNSNIYKGTAY